MSEAVGNDASQIGVLGHAHHCVRLAAASLAVSEYGAVVSFEDAFHKSEGTLVINLKRSKRWV